MSYQCLPSSVISSHETKIFARQIHYWPSRHTLLLLFIMPLTVLSDSDVRTLLLQLTKQDILDLQQSLADALHYYSTSTEDDLNGCCSSYQPLRTALKRSDGQTTLLMPASR